MVNLIEIVYLIIKYFWHPSIIIKIGFVAIPWDEYLNSWVLIGRGVIEPFPGPRRFYPLQLGRH